MNGVVCLVEWFFYISQKDMSSKNRFMVAQRGGQVLLKIKIRYMNQVHDYSFIKSVKNNNNDSAMTSHDFWDFEKVMRHRERLALAKIHSFDAGGVPYYGLGTTGMAQRSQDANEPLREIQQAVVDKWMLNKSIELSRERTESCMGRRQGRQSPLVMHQEHKELILSQRTRFCEKV